MIIKYSKQISVLRIRKYFFRIRIRGAVILTNGSRSGSMRPVNCGSGQIRINSKDPEPEPDPESIIPNLLIQIRIQEANCFTRIHRIQMQIRNRIRIHQIRMQIRNTVIKKYTNQGRQVRMLLYEEGFFLLQYPCLQPGRPKPELGGPSL